MIFCYNVYEAFLYIFSSKTNVKNAPSLPALLDFCACWMQVSHTNMSVCVCQAHAFLYDCARLLNILIISRVSLLVSSFLKRPSTCTPKPNRGICFMWVQSWTERWPRAIPSSLAESGWRPVLRNSTRLPPWRAAIQKFLQQRIVPWLLQAV